MATLVFAIGLPGSGKSTFLKNMCISNNDYYADIDQWMNHENKLSFEDAYHKAVYMRGSKIENLYLDGPLFTEKAVVSMLKDFMRIKSPNLNIDTIKIYHYNEDRDACISNDKGRRKKDAHVTIMHAPYIKNISDEFIETIKNITKISNIIVTEKIVKKYSVYEKFIEPCEKFNFILKSDCWCLGGNVCDYAGNDEELEVEEPVDFYQLTELLNNISSKLTAEQFNYIFDNKVEKSVTSDSDWYGGTAIYCHYECNINEIYNYLKDNNLIND